MPEKNGTERPSYGYTTAGGDRVSALRDMFDGGGAGRPGSTFQGGGIISDIGNAMGGPSSFGFGEGGGDTNRGATLGRMAGGMMFGPLGMIGGGILGNMLGGGMNRGQAPAPSPMPMPALRSAPSPAMAALAPRASTVPTQRPFAPTDASVPVMPSLPSVMDMPGAVERFIAQYGGMPRMQAAYTPPPLPGTVMMDPSFSMPAPGVNMPMFPAAGSMPRAPMPMDPQMNPLSTAPLMIDFRTGRPMAMTPPRVQ